jgi:hypothetical protein
METIKNINGFEVIEYNKAHIYIIKNILDDSFCKKFINLIETIPKKKITYCDGNNVKCYISEMNELLDINDEYYYDLSTDDNIYDTLLKNVNSGNRISTNKLNGITLNEIEIYNDCINEKISMIKNIMVDVNNKLIFDQNTGYILRKIYGSTRLHTDGISQVYDSSNITFIKNNKIGTLKMIRNNTLIFSLNDNYQGGMLNFPYFDISIKMQKGSVIIFPPYWTHEHEVTNLENDTYRYTITTWSCEKI